ncbi:competence protein ComK [Metabacillus malikii]|uniref:Competence protein ComK n=1 Tax=Metabacillus malikii TaxID=1504265 RepID=A0ABT9ZM13_9BACI|nr:competence protein ComK [Metabacillus malikii]MDQ0232235.1 competence protein ComK [Metabacillus malikii]
MVSLEKKDYIINRLTMALLPSEDGLSTTILETDEKFTIESRPLKIMDNSCRYFGSSYIGRKSGTKAVMGVTHKSPIMVDPANMIYFFPTTSSTRKNCIWLSHSHIKHHEKTTDNQTIVTFSNDEEYLLNISIGSFEKQFHRTAQLRTLMTTRIEQEQRKMDKILMSSEDEKYNQIYAQFIREIKKYL